MQIKIMLVLSLFIAISGCATVKSPLVKASQDGDILATEKLINEGADINEQDSKGYTPLMYAVWSGKTETVKTLIHKGADINKADNYGWTPLFWALYYGHLEIASLLIDKGANVNIKDSSGTTPLIVAASNGHFEIAEILIGKNVDLFAVDASGYKASDYAKFLLKPGKRVFKPADYERNMAFLKLIKEAENSQILSGRMNTENPQMARIFAITYKASKCINPDIDYDVYISDQEAPNAWVNVSGNITFTKSALEKYDDDTLSFMAAHEISHDKLGHVAKKMAVSHSITGVMLVANALLPGVGLLNYIINPTITNNYSKTQEYDADQLASDFCSKCFGMSIETQVAILQKMKKISKSSGGGFWATHPSWDERVKNINTTDKPSLPATEVVRTEKGIKGLKGIELFNGKIIEGKILSINTDVVIIRTKDGTVSSYSFREEVRGFIPD